MYVQPNFKTKKDLRYAVAYGKKVTLFQPGAHDGNESGSGSCTVEGPHCPEAYKWYAEVTVKDGIITKVE